VSATTWRRIQLGLTLIWIVLIPPSILYWRDSIPYLVGLSVWANVAGSAAGWMAARGEETAVDKTDLAPIREAQERIEAKLDALLARP
jgi:hypothetical protein